MPLSDTRIISLIKEHGMLKNAILENVHEGSISYGLTCNGYDLRAGYHFKVFEYWAEASTGVMLKEEAQTLGKKGEILDPKNPSSQTYCEYDLTEDEVLILNPGEYALTHSMERFNLPRDVMAIILGKSTYARSHVLINATPAESEWSGFLTIEIANIGPCPVIIYPGEGIAQAVFFNIDGPVSVSYADRGGKYNDQGKRENLGKVKR